MWLASHQLGLQICCLRTRFESIFVLPITHSWYFPIDQTPAYIWTRYSHCLPHPTHPYTQRRPFISTQKRWRAWKVQLDPRCQAISWPWMSTKATWWNADSEWPRCQPWKWRWPSQPPYPVAWPRCMWAREWRSWAMTCCSTLSELHRRRWCCQINTTTRNSALI